MRGTAGRQLQDRPVENCHACDRNAAAADPRPWEQVHVSANWRLTLAFNTSLPGWLVLLPRRHVEGLHELDPAEAEEMGRLLRAASAALVEVTDCLKTYVMLFAEAEGFSHLHLHVVPRHAELSAERRGPAVFAYLGAPPEQWVPESERDLLAARLHDALLRRASGR